MRDPQLARDVAGTDAVVGELHYPLPDDVRERPSVDKHTSQLVDTTVTCNRSQGLERGTGIESRRIQGKNDDFENKSTQRMMR